MRLELVRLLSCGLDDFHVAVKTLIDLFPKQADTWINLAIGYPNGAGTRERTPPQTLRIPLGGSVGLFQSFSRLMATSRMILMILIILIILIISIYFTFYN